jgi:hypothetical protein
MSRPRRVEPAAVDIDSTWVPQVALHYFWARVDSLHGRGGKYSLGRLSTPNDPDFGDGWRLERFLEALDRDRAEIDAFIAVHPEQADRLRGWLPAILRRHLRPYRPSLWRPL